jgi:hypothetical protein
MRYTDRIKNLAPLYPELSRVWIKTDNPRQPLKSVWISESALRNSDHENCGFRCEAEIAELSEDHLLLVA